MPTTDARILTDWFARLAVHGTGLSSAESSGDLHSAQRGQAATAAADVLPMKSAAEDNVDTVDGVDAEVVEELANAAAKPSSSVRRPQPAERLLLSIARQAMACEFEVLLNQHQYPQAADLAVDALDRVQLLENKLSVYKTHSDLSQLNRFGWQRPVEVASDTHRLLCLARDLHGLTSGAFDITAGTLSEVWGFSRRAGQMPSEQQIAEALHSVGTEHLDLSDEHCQVGLRRQGVQVNPGGIGKGYALDRAAGGLIEGGVYDFMLHGGLSSVVARGHRQHPQTGGGWLVSLRHPWRLEQVLGSIRLRDQALATSGSGKQFFHFGGKRYSHIIDPRSGWPAQSMMSATVICPSGAVADALATALFVMGPEAGREFCRRNPSIGAILIFQDGQSGRPVIEVHNLSTDTWIPADASLSTDSQ